MVVTFAGLNVGPIFTYKDGTQFALAAMRTPKGEDDAGIKNLNDVKLILREVTTYLIEI